MKKSVLFVVLFVFLAVFVSGCAPASTPAPTPTSTFVPPTFTPSPIPPTLTPEPTATIQPSPTPIILSDVINQTFSGASVSYQENFDDSANNALPDGWKSDDQSAAMVTSDGKFKVNPKDTGDWSSNIIYFSKEKITPNKGVYLSFMYTGDKEGFTLGFDSIRDDGQRIVNGQKGFYSVAMQLINGEGLTAHIIQDTFQGAGYFKGNLKLQENTWYDVAMGFDDEGNYVIKIWEPSNIGTQLTYFRNWKDFPKNYYFISWISAKRNLFIDNFTIFEFESIVN